MPLTHSLALRIVTDLVEKHGFVDSGRSNYAIDEDLIMRTLVTNDMVQWSELDEDDGEGVEVTLSFWDHENRWVVEIYLHVVPDKEPVGVKVELVLEPDTHGYVTEFEEHFEVTNEDEWARVLKEEVEVQLEAAFDYADEEEQQLSEEETDSEAER
jgi:hypothetical protein